MSKKEVKLKGVMEISQVVTYLEDLVASLKEGKICVRQGEQFVTLCPDQRVDVEVKASAKKGKEKFEMEMSWYQESVEEEPQAMHISSEEPDQDEQGSDPLPAVSAPAIEIQGEQGKESNVDEPDAVEEAQKTGP